MIGIYVLGIRPSRPIVANFHIIAFLETDDPTIRVHARLGTDEVHTLFDLGLVGPQKTSRSYKVSTRTDLAGQLDEVPNGAAQVVWLVD